MHVCGETKRYFLIREKNRKLKGTEVDDCFALCDVVNYDIDCLFVDYILSRSSIRLNY